eukprot:5099108-Prymnesium_polylepis.1
MARATLDAAGFFAALQDEGIPDLTGTPFSTAVYRSFCNEADTGVPHDKAQLALRRVRVVREIFRRVNGGRPLSFETFRKISAESLAKLLASDGDAPQSPSEIPGPTRQRRTSLSFDQNCAEAFLRHDTNGDGQIDELEFTTMCLTMCVLAETFEAEAVARWAEAEPSLTPRGLTAALRRLGFADVAQVMQGQLLDSVYERFDTNLDGDILYHEFVRGTMRLLLPISWQ